MIKCPDTPVLILILVAAIFVVLCGTWLLDGQNVKIRKLERVTEEQSELIKYKNGVISACDTEANSLKIETASLKSQLNDTKVICDHYLDLAKWLMESQDKDAAKKCIPKQPRSKEGTKEPL